MNVWVLAATLVSGIMVVASCSNNDNSTPPDTTALTAWQAGKTVNAEAVAAYGGLDMCFAADPSPMVYGSACRVRPTRRIPI